ncbi:MAG: site-specific integrase [Kiritimatiellae bacterium]|nr:site-specific integrase [Kiritimatiellia bacterium]
MAREKGTGNLQQEKSGRWTLRIGINGRRLSRSTGTKDRDKAEAFLNRFLAPLGLGATRLPLAEAWRHYEMSPNRRDIAQTTLVSKRMVWMAFARWMEHYHIEIGHLAEVTEEAVAEYLAEFRCHHSATTYNNHVCVLREIFRVLADKAGVTHDPWEKVSLRSDDSISRRELSIDEVERLYVAAVKEGWAWKLLLMTGIYTGLRLGDCCRLKWENVNLEHRVIQVIPEKTKRHMHGRPITIPIHPSLLDAFITAKQERNVTSGGFVNPTIGKMYLDNRWHVDEGLRKIFKGANITMSVKMEGRSRKSVVASFHSLRHTFVSLSANAGVPLPVVQSIVGHTSTAMTRHYYHENEDVLRQAVSAIPSFGTEGGWKPAVARSAAGAAIDPPARASRTEGVPARLRRLDRLFAKNLVTEGEYATHRARILAEM